MESADELTGMVRKGDIVYIHDPQPAGTGPARRVGRRQRRLALPHRHRPSRPLRSRRPGTSCAATSADADAYVFSRERFAWEGLDRERIWIVPPSIDIFSPKNQDLEPDAVRSILAVIGIGGTAITSPGRSSAIWTAARPASVVRAEIDQDEPLPDGAPLVSQVSRWDRLKDPVGVLALLRRALPHPDAHLLLVGPSVAEVADDPEGAEVLAEVRASAERPHPVLRGAGAPGHPADGRRRGERGDGQRDPAALGRGRPEEPGRGLRVDGRRGDVEGEAGGGRRRRRDPGSDRERRLRRARRPERPAAVGGAIDGLLADPERAARMGRVGPAEGDRAVPRHPAPDPVHRSLLAGMLGDSHDL